MTENNETKGAAAFIALLEAPVEDGEGFIAQWSKHMAVLRRAPGFRDARLHQALSPQARFPMIAVVRWDDLAASERANADPEIRATVPNASEHAKVRRAAYELFDAIGPDWSGADGGGVTMINAFDLPADRVGEFLEVWTPRARWISGTRGFLGYRMLRAVGTAQVPLVNLVHYSDEDAWKALQANPDFQARRAADPPYVTANPTLVEVVAEFS
ncbi:MAG TPA: antibiotic biosynthesis monooxygenase [Actinospica sp.]|nr:antibiotic biosynthesis monooxygenase [Actinospica sp.]